MKDNASVNKNSYCHFLYTGTDTSMPDTLYVFELYVLVEAMSHYRYTANTHLVARVTNQLTSPNRILSLHHPGMSQHSP